MPISFKTARKTQLKEMYNDMVDAYIEATCKHGLSKEEKSQMRRDGKEWKTEFQELIKEL